MCFSCSRAHVEQAIGDAPSTSEATPTTATAAPAASDVDGTIEVDGRSRTYHVHVPTGVSDGPVPLLIGLHGGLGSGDQTRATPE